MVYLCLAQQIPFVFGIVGSKSVSVDVASVAVGVEGRQTSHSLFGGAIEQGSKNRTLQCNYASVLGLV